MLNLNVGGNGQRSAPRSIDNGPAVRSISDNRPRIDKSPEGKGARELAKAMNVLSFDPNAFAWVMAREDFIIQKRALESLLAMVDLWANRVGIAGQSDEELELAITAARARDALSVFRDRGML